MERKEFIHQCGFACLGLVVLGPLLESCGTSAVLGEISGNRISVPLSRFVTQRKGKQIFRRYLIVRNEQLNYPIVVFRESEGNYTALLLRCTHQHNELSVSGELLTCPAHGSEFNTKGEVVQGPADSKLRQFPISTDAQNLIIELA